MQTPVKVTRGAGLVLRGWIRITTPDGSTQSYKLPSAPRLREGGKCNIAVMWGQRLVLVWFVRVKGGWKLAGV